MPRKAKNKDKPPLLFLERASCGARLQNAPEVRAALNPREFFTESGEQHSTTLNSWVSPQFDTSLAAAPPVRRGRRKCLSTTSILDGCSQLSRKTSVCKFPSLTFQTRSRSQFHQAKSTRTKKAAESAVVPDTGKQPQGSCQNKRTASSATHSDTPKRQTTSVRKRTVERFSDGAASSRGCLDQPETTPVHVTERIPIVGGASTPASADISCVAPPPDVDTPTVIQEESSGPSCTALHFLLSQTCTPSRNQPPDILVADTPERDYGLKVTWRRRRGLMLLLQERGFLSDSDALIHS